MRKILIVAFVSIFLLADNISAQNSVKPKLVATWSYSGSGDYLEFIDNTVGEMKGYISEFPNGKLVALVCSKDDLPTALVSSVGFPLYFFEKSQQWNIAANQVYLARSAKCSANLKKVTDQYWFVPENSDLKNDEITLAKNISYERRIVGYYENYESQEAKSEFNRYITEFIKKLNDNSEAQGFIVSNLDSRKTNRKIEEVLRQLRKEKVNVNRVKIIRKKKFFDLYPELFTITINKNE